MQTYGEWSGLGPAIHAFLPVDGVCSEDVGGRDKPGHGEENGTDDRDASGQVRQKFPPITCESCSREGHVVSARSPPPAQQQIKRTSAAVAWLSRRDCEDLPTQIWLLQPARDRGFEYPRSVPSEPSPGDHEDAAPAGFA